MLCFKRLPVVVTTYQAFLICSVWLVPQATHGDSCRIIRSCSAFDDSEAACRDTTIGCQWMPLAGCDDRGPSQCSDVEDSERCNQYGNCEWSSSGTTGGTSGSSSSSSSGVGCVTTKSCDAFSYSPSTCGSAWGCDWDSDTRDCKKFDYQGQRFSCEDLPTKTKCDFSNCEWKEPGGGGSSSGSSSNGGGGGGTTPGNTETTTVGRCESSKTCRTLRDNRSGCDRAIGCEWDSFCYTSEAAGVRTCTTGCSNQAGGSDCGDVKDSVSCESYSNCRWNYQATAPSGSSDSGAVSSLNSGGGIDLVGLAGAVLLGLEFYL